MIFGIFLEIPESTSLFLSEKCNLFLTQLGLGDEEEN